MSNEKFFLILPSDSSADVYPDNKVSNYTTFLPNEISVDPSRWEVALQEVQFPHSWFNVREGNNVLIKIYHNLQPEENKILLDLLNKNPTTISYISDKLDLHNANPTTISYIPDELGLHDKNPTTTTTISYFPDEKIFLQRITVPPGNYTDSSVLIDFLNREEDKYPRAIRFTMDTFSRRTNIKMKSHTTLDWNKSDIAKCLGYAPASTISSQHDEAFEKTSHVTFLFRPFDSIYIYCDIIENQQVGNIKVPLLRTVPVQSRFGEINWVHYDRLHFLKISRKNINNIEINLRDETGEFVSFESGKVIVTLVFRRIAAKFYPE